MISHDKAYTDQIFEALRNRGNYMYSCRRLLMDRFRFGSYPIASIRDLTVGYDSKQKDRNYQPVLPVDPSSHMITYEFENGACLTLRTSGTEPKIKYYLEVTHKDKQQCEGKVKLIHSQ